MYKRNQMEWAIWQFIDRGHQTSDLVPTEIVHLVRRLIDFDRQLSVNTRRAETWMHRFAFIDGIPQGKGGENSYRAEETVGVWLGIQYLAIGLPQREVVQFLRALKPELEAVIRGLLARYRSEVEAAARDKGQEARRLRLGEYLTSEDHAYVVTDTISANGVYGSLGRIGERESPNICRGWTQLREHIETQAGRDRRVVLVEVANAVLSLAYFLATSHAAKRGAKVA